MHAPLTEEKKHEHQSERAMSAFSLVLCYSILAFCTVRVVVAQSTVSQEDIDAIWLVGQQDAEFKHLFRNHPKDNDIGRALEYFKALEKTGRTVPFWPAGWTDTAKPFISVSSIAAAYPAAVIAQATTPLPVEWELIVSRLVRYKIMTGNANGCGDGAKSVLDEETGQISCSCPQGKYCVSTDETSSTPFVAAIVLESIILAMLFGGLSWLIWLDTKSNNKIYSVDFARNTKRALMLRKSRNNRRQKTMPVVTSTKTV